MTLVHRVLSGLFIGLVFLNASPAVSAPGDTSKPADSLLAALPVKPAALLTGMRLSLIEERGIYHLVLPTSRISSVGRNILSGNVKKALSEPFSPTGVRAYHFEPEGLPPTVKAPWTTTNSFSWSQLTSICFDKYVMPQSIKRMIPNLSSFNF